MKLCVWLVAGLLAMTVKPGAAWCQEVDPEELAVILFNEIIQVAAAGRVSDVSFEDTGYNRIHPNEIIWMIDPTSAGIVAVASRPIPGTAKAAETLGQRGEDVLRQAIALDVASDKTLILEESGRLVVMRSGWVDTLQVGDGPVTSADVAASLSGLLYVLWGPEVRIYADPPGEPLWSFRVDEDAMPVSSMCVAANGEVLLAGRGETVVVCYDLDPDGRYRRTRAASAKDLGMAAADGISLTPSMLLPVEGREGWVEEDRFIVLSNAQSAALVALERSTMQVVGRFDLGPEVPGAAPGRFDISNRGQLAYVDTRTMEAFVLPTRVVVAMVEGSKFRWRREPERTYRFQGGEKDSTQTPGNPDR